MKTAKKYATGVVPGSFDPITNGHLDVIKRAAELCETVFVAVMINEQKEYMFTLPERKAIAEAACEGISGVRVISSSGMLFELCRELSCEVIIKGVRNDTDREYELKMAQYNSEHNPATITLLLDSKEELRDISSTEVRKILSEDGDLSAYLPERAMSKIKEIRRTL